MRQVLVEKLTRVIDAILERMIANTDSILNVNMQERSLMLYNLVEALNKLEFGNEFKMALSQETYEGLVSLITNRNEVKSALDAALAKVAELQQKDTENQTLIADIRAQLEAALNSNVEGNQQLANIAELIRAEDAELAANNPPVEPPVG